MHLRLADVIFDLPDDWRDTTTHQFLTADRRGTLIVEPEHESAVAEHLFKEAFEHYSDVLGPMIIYSNRIALRRGHQTVPAAEGEQVMDGVNRLRFALVAMTSAEWLAIVRLVVPTTAGFVPLLQRIVASARFSDEKPAPPAPAANVRTVHAGPLSLQIPKDWRSPDTFEFLAPIADEVTLTVTVASPMLPVGSIVWDQLISEPFRIVQTTLAPPAPGGLDWEVEWQLDLPSQPVPWIVRKAVKQVTATTVVTAVLRGPETLRPQWAAAWSLFQRSLHPGFGR